MQFEKTYGETFSPFEEAELDRRGISSSERFTKQLAMRKWLLCLYKETFYPPTSYVKVVPLRPFEGLLVSKEDHIMYDDWEVSGMKPSSVPFMT